MIHTKKETRTVVYDDELRLEAYRFEGIEQPFPSHFTNYFNQFIGLAPGTYREIFSEKSGLFLSEYSGKGSSKDE